MLAGTVYTVSRSFSEAEITKMSQKVVVNDALAIAQLIAGILDEDHSVKFLRSIDELSNEDWKTAKIDLPGVNATARQNKEANIRDIVRTFKNNEIKVSFALLKLSLIPGFQKGALELSSFTAACLEATKSNSLRLASLASDSAATTAAFTSAQPLVRQHAPINTDKIELVGAAAVQKPTHNATQASNWPNTNQLKYKASSKIPEKSKKTTTWTVGTSQSKIKEAKAYQLRSVCLAVKSGYDETQESLKEEISESAAWENYQNLTIEPVSRSSHTTMFRVKFTVAASLSDQWTKPTSWPERMSATQWRGNPNSTLKPLDQRQYTKKLYIGNLGDNTTVEMVTENMKTIYKNEIDSKIIQTITVHFNLDGIARGKQIQSQAANHMVNRSVCVILTSNPGKPLSDVTLKLTQYPPQVRKTVRYWRGRIPWATDQQSNQQGAALSW